MVVLGGVLDGEHEAAAGGIGHVRVARAPVLLDADVAARVREVDVEAAGARVVGWERHRQQAALAAVEHEARDVEEGRGLRHAALDEADHAALLRHEQPGRIARRRGHVGGEGVPARDRRARERPRRAARHQPRHLAAVLVHDVEVPGGVLPEGAELGERESRGAVVGGGLVQRERADLAVVVVGVEVAADEACERRVADHVPADHRRAARGRVVGQRRDHGSADGAARPAGPSDQPLTAGPAEVGAARARERDPVELLARALAHVADQQVAVGAVEGEAVGVAQAVGEDLGPGAGTARERVVRRDQVAGAGLGLRGRRDAEPEQDRQGCRSSREAARCRIHSDPYRSASAGTLRRGGSGSR